MPESDQNAESDQTNRQLTWMVCTTPLMTLITDFGLSTRVSMFEHIDWDLFLGPLPRSSRIREGGDW